MEVSVWGIERVPGPFWVNKFPQFDLSSLDSVKTSAEELKKKLGGERSGSQTLETIIGYATIAMMADNVLSIDGYERIFAVNCPGHFASINFLLGWVLPKSRIAPEAINQPTRLWECSNDYEVV